MRDGTIAFKGAQKVFGKSRETVHALQDVDLKIESGEFVVVGLSGAGKSILIRSVNGLVPLSGGELRVDGREVSRADRRELKQPAGQHHGPQLGDDRGAPDHDRRRCDGGGPREHPRPLQAGVRAAPRGLPRKRHTHIPFCPHGSEEPLEVYLDRAVEPGWRAR